MNGSPGSALLERPAAEAARRLALHRLEQARAAAAALAAGDDPEALHDFRVALRRLRSLVGALRPELAEAVRPRLRRRLRKLAAATNAGRDAEVALEWLERLRDGATPRERRTLAELSGRFDERRRRETGAAGREIAARFGPLHAALGDRLARFEVELAIDGEPGASLRERLVGEIETHREELADALAAAAGGDDDDLHRARIRGKRLRYLIEPLAEASPAAASALGSLRGLQDLLGELNDLRLLVDEIAEAGAELERRHVLEAASGQATRPRREAGGLRAIATRAGAERSRRLDRLAREWLAEGAAGAAALAATLDATALELSAPAAPPPA